MKQLIAEDLLKIKAVFLRPNEPFIWASGIKSPIYCDNRLTLGDTQVRNDVENGLAALIKEHYPEAEVLMGTSTAGIAHAAITATILDLPMGYVRSGDSCVSDTCGRSTHEDFCLRIMLFYQCCEAVLNIVAHLCVAKRKTVVAIDRTLDTTSPCEWLVWTEEDGFNLEQVFGDKLFHYFSFMSLSVYGFIIRRTLLRSVGMQLQGLRQR